MGRNITESIVEQVAPAGVTSRDALLPKLISGELRVKDTERFVERVEA